MQRHQRSSSLPLLGRKAARSAGVRRWQMLRVLMQDTHSHPRAPPRSTRATGRVQTHRSLFHTQTTEVHRMKRIATSLALLSLLILTRDTRAAEDAAGDLDHLICYKMKDPMTAPARFDLLARLQPEFSRAGCTLVLDRNDQEVNSEFCVPASKRKVTAPNHDADLAGDVLHDDYICYRIECPAAAKPPHKIVSDQFGNRQFGFGRPARICVPATKEPFGCGITGRNHKNRPICGGVCPNGHKCAGNQTTRPCGAAVTPFEVYPDSLQGRRRTHGPPGTVCTAGDDNACSCKPRGCGLDTAGQCGGACADASTVCSAVANGGCECTPPVSSSGCGLDPEFGECGGECPPDLFCLPPLAGGDGCVCRGFGGFD